jgi:hypothetical protein
MRWLWDMIFGEREPRRLWQAVAPNSTPIRLGVLTEAQAVERTSKMGPVSYVDVPNGFVFFNTHLGADLSQR